MILPLLLNALVNRVNRRLCILFVKLSRSTCEVGMRRIAHRYRFADRNRVREWLQYGLYGAPAFTLNCKFRPAAKAVLPAANTKWRKHP